MKHVAACTVTSVLCALWLGACSTTEKAAAASTPEATAPTAQNPADSASLSKDMPATLEGEIRRAQQLRSKGDLDEASQSLAQLMLIDPDDARVVGEYGKTLTQQGHARDAVAFLQRAVQLQPNDWSLYSALGVAYDQADDHVQARHSYARALALAPGEASVLNNMAVSYMLTKDWAGAQRYLAQASTKGGSEHKIANNMAMLSDLDAQNSPAVSKTQAAPAVAAHPAPSATNLTPPATPAAQTAPATRLAVAPPKSIQPAVVMQALPKDPEAGPVKQKPAHPVRLATRTKAPERVAHLAPPPALRTAAEAN